MGCFVPDEAVFQQVLDGQADFIESDIPAIPSDILKIIDGNIVSKSQIIDNIFLDQCEILNRCPDAFVC